MSRLLAVFVSLCTAAVLAGCASSVKPSVGATGSFQHGSPSATTAPPPQMVRANEANNTKTVTLHPGDALVLQLHNTYWKITPPGGNVLSQVGKVSYGTKPVEARDCVPGAGCGTLQVKYRAAHPGRTEVKATRTTCGEAMLCSRAAGIYRLTVVVK